MEAIHLSTLLQQQSGDNDKKNVQSPRLEKTIRLDAALSEGLDFILSHLDHPHFSRNISTIVTDSKQITVYSKQEALARFKQANGLDCRMNAYSTMYAERDGHNKQPPYK
jgi:hypothetical protein